VLEVTEMLASVSLDLLAPGDLAVSVLQRIGLYAASDGGRQ